MGAVALWFVLLSSVLYFVCWPRSMCLSPDMEKGSTLCLCGCLLRCVILFVSIFLLPPPHLSCCLIVVLRVAVLLLVFLLRSCDLRFFMCALRRSLPLCAILCFLPMLTPPRQCFSFVFVSCLFLDVCSSLFLRLLLARVSHFLSACPAFFRGLDSCSG